MHPVKVYQEKIFFFTFYNGGFTFLLIQFHYLFPEQERRKKKKKKKKKKLGKWAIYPEVKKLFLSLEKFHLSGYLSFPILTVPEIGDHHTLD